MDPQPLKPGDRIVVTIEKGVYGGLGLARHQGQVVLVPRAFRGDRGRVVVKSVTRGYARGSLEDLELPAAERRSSPCPVSDRCGGCAYQEIAYAEQLALKQAILLETLRRGGAPWEGEVPVVGSPEEGWRTRATLHFRHSGGRLALGFHRAGTHEVVDVESCLHLSPQMNRAARSLLLALEPQAAAWPGLRRLDLAESGDGTELVALLEGELDARQIAGLASLADGIPALTGIGAVEGGRHRRFVSLRGEPYVHATVGGTTLRAHVRSFFQANRFLADGLVSEVAGLLAAGGPLLDLYAGVGLFALPLAAGAERVLGVEQNATAVADARHNASTAGIRNVRFVEGDVAAALSSGRPEAGERIVLDPPRTGAGPEVVAAVAARRPQAIVYVSCDPPTLARDLAAFRRTGYQADSIRAFDLFPDTAHLETVVRLSPR
jgi:23S rRNA (uracil1939-C5)-methyltransferase